MADLQLTAQHRSVTGRKVKQLRNKGLIPVVVYGKTVSHETVQIEERSLERVLHSGGMSQLIELAVEGAKTHNALIREVSRHPVSHKLQHVDFYAVNMSEKQHVSVPIEATGKANGLGAGLILLQVLDHITIEALPADIPAHIVVDITPLTLERPITVADLPPVPGVIYLEEADTEVFILNVTREEVEPEPVETTGTEPEVVSKGKREEEEEEE
jgi:large subunit ribosomal protein L25